MEIINLLLLVNVILQQVMLVVLLRLLYWLRFVDFLDLATI